MRMLKQSSTAQVLMFLMVDSADHITGKTGLSPTVTLSKNGAGFGSPAGAVTEVGSGWYKVAGNATDTDTLGPLNLHATATGADPTDEEFTVVAFNPQVATNLGLSALPTANPAANGGLLTGDANNYVAGIQGTKNQLDDLNDLSQANVRSAVGLAGADLDAQLAALAAQLTTIDDLLDTEIADIRTRVLLALPAAAPDGPGGLPISDAGGLDLDTLLGRLNATVSSRATPAEVNAEVVDALNVDAYGEPGQAAWPVSQSIQAKIGFLTKLARNRITQDATTLKVFNDDGVTVGQKATVSDDTVTYDRGELATGP